MPMNAKALLTKLTKFRAKSRTITYQQAGTYLAQKKMPQPLIEACVAFLKDRARENGETRIGPNTIDSIIKGSWSLPEQELERVYHTFPFAIRQYEYHLTSAPDMPSMTELVRPVRDDSPQAQRAYIFLSESALRVVYGIVYEPAYIWRVVRFYDDEPITAMV
jgi:hypothetical protein